MMYMLWPYIPPMWDPLIMWYWMSWMTIVPMYYMAMYSLMFENYKMMLEFIRRMFEARQ